MFKINYEHHALILFYLVFKMFFYAHWNMEPTWYAWYADDVIEIINLSCHPQTFILYSYRQWVSAQTPKEKKMSQVLFSFGELYITSMYLVCTFKLLFGIKKNHAVENE